MNHGAVVKQHRPCLHHRLDTFVTHGLPVKTPFMTARNDVGGAVILGKVCNGPNAIALRFDALRDDATAIVAAPNEPVTMQRLRALSGHDGDQLRDIKLDLGTEGSERSVCDAQNQRIDGDIPNRRASGDKAARSFGVETRPFVSTWSGAVNPWCDICPKGRQPIRGKDITDDASTVACHGGGDFFD